MSEESSSPTRRSVLAATAAAGALGLTTSASTGIFAGALFSEEVRADFRLLRKSI
jgi:hypothetical protein